MEISLLNWIQQFRNPVLDYFFSFYTLLNNHGEMWIVLTIGLLCFKKTRTLGILCALGLLTELFFSEMFLKNMIKRVRPFAQNSIQLIIPKPNTYSFPSGHTASSFVIVSLFYLTKEKGRRLILALATLMAFSRLYLYVHHPTDIIGGILVGSFCGWLVLRLYNRYDQCTNHNRNRTKP